jgi:hypothetical protein
MAPGATAIIRDTVEVFHVLRDTVILQQPHQSWLASWAPAIGWGVAGGVGFGAVFLRWRLERREKRRIIKMVVLDEVTAIVQMLILAQEGVEKPEGSLTDTVIHGLEQNTERYQRVSEYLIYLKPMLLASEIAGWFREVRIATQEMRKYVIGDEIGNTQLLLRDVMRASDVGHLNELIERGDRILVALGYQRRPMGGADPKGSPQKPTSP